MKNKDGMLFIHTVFVLSYNIINFLLICEENYEDADPTVPDGEGPTVPDGKDPTGPDAMDPDAGAVPVPENTAGCRWPSLLRPLQAY